MIYRNPSIGIALSGGGAKGLAHIGVLEALEEEGIKIDKIAGTSMGAIVGGLYALNPESRWMKERAYNIVSSDIFKSIGLEKFRETDEDTWFDRFRNRLKSGMVMTESFLKQAFIQEENVEKIFKELFKEKTFSDTALPFAAVALDLITGNDVIFKEGPLWRAVKASAAIPGIFPPVRYNNMILVDGGVTANVPVEAVKNLGANFVIAVVFDLSPAPPGNLNTAFEIYMRSDELAKVKLERLLIHQADVVIPVDTKHHHWTEFESIDFFIEVGKNSTKQHIKEIKSGLTRKKGFFSRIFSKI